MLQENVRAWKGGVCRTVHPWHPQQNPEVARAELTGARTLGMPGVSVSVVLQAETRLQPHCQRCRNPAWRLEDLMFPLTKPVAGRIGRETQMLSQEA